MTYISLCSRLWHPRLLFLTQFYLPLPCGRASLYLEYVLENMFLTFSPEYVNIFVLTFSGKLVPYVFTRLLPCNRTFYILVVVLYPYSRPW